MTQVAWSGSLEIERVSIPLKLMSAAKETGVSFVNICPIHHATVEQIFQCNTDGKIVEDPSWGWLNGNHVAATFTKDEVEAARRLAPNTPQSIKLTESRSIYDFDPAFVKATYRAWTPAPYQKVLASFRRALDRSQSVMLGEMVLDCKLNLVAVRATPRMGLIVMRMFWQDEVRPELPCSDEKADSEMYQSFAHLIMLKRKGREAPVLEGIKNPHKAMLLQMVKERQEMTISEALDRFYNGQTG